VREIPPVKGFVETSFLDWPGRVASVLFLAGCNFRCPFCHNPELVGANDELREIPLSGILSKLQGMAGWVDGVIVTGGEPTVHEGLADLLALLREIGLAVKLDTNGSHPAALERLLAGGLLDHVALDLKAPLTLDAYGPLCGVTPPLAAIRGSVDLIKASGVGVTFRTTVVPGFHTIEGLASLRELTAPHPLLLQAFSPKVTLDPGFRSVAPMAESTLAAWDRAVNGTTIV
jgi:pyruvate formate lyase activating enzyme